MHKKYDYAEITKRMEGNMSDIFRVLSIRHVDSAVAEAQLKHRYCSSFFCFVLTLLFRPYCDSYRGADRSAPIFDFNFRKRKEYWCLTVYKLTFHFYQWSPRKVPLINFLLFLFFYVYSINGITYNSHFVAFTWFSSMTIALSQMINVYLLIIDPYYEVIDNDLLKFSTFFYFSLSRELVYIINTPFFAGVANWDIYPEGRC